MIRKELVTGRVLLCWWEHPATGVKRYVPVVLREDVKARARLISVSSLMQVPRQKNIYRVDPALVNDKAQIRDLFWVPGQTFEKQAGSTSPEEERWKMRTA